MCDCPAGTVGSVYRWNVNAPHSCITPDEAQLIEWTDTTHFYGYELRYGPVVGLRADGEGIWDYDHRQELYVRAKLVAFRDEDGNEVAEENFPEMKNNLAEFSYGSAGFYWMALPEAGFYQLEYEFLDNLGNVLFSELSGMLESGEYDATALAPVDITFDNVPDILPNNITYSVTIQMINELGEPVYLGPKMEFEGEVYEWMDFEWDLWIEYQSPVNNRTWRSWVNWCSADENGRCEVGFNLVDSADNPWALENEEPTPAGAIAPEEFENMSPEEKEKQRKQRLEGKSAGITAGSNEPRTVYVTPGLVRFHFMNWGWNEGISGLPLEEINDFPTEWFIFASANCTDDCATNAQCTVEGICECDNNYSGDGYSYCVIEDDECEIYPGICGENAECIDRLIDYDCECHDGFAANADDVGCSDIDECARDHPCADGTRCVNTYGGFTCEIAPPCEPKCDAGYECIDGECVDINECEEGKDTCRDFETCRNVQGKYICDFNADLCDDLDLPFADWKGRQGMRYIYKSEAGSLFGMKLKNNGRRVNIRNELYSGLFFWTKDVCGMDFMRAMRDGRLEVTLIDSTDIYDLKHVHYKAAGKYSLIGLSYDLTDVVTKDTPWAFKQGVATKNMGSDDVQIMISGLDKVTFLTTEENCLLTGASAALEAGDYSDLERACMINKKTFWSKPSLP